MSADRTLRKVLHSAYTFVRSVEVNRASSALTLDHLIQEQIDTYKQGSKRSILDAQGEVAANRISKIDALDTLQQELDQVVSAIKAAGSDAGRLRELGIYEVDQDAGEE